MTKNTLAPIGVSTYKRLGHLKRTILALQNNRLAEESDLYIFSDHPRKGDEKEVIELRRYLKTIRGFARLEIIERDSNDRIKNNRGGMKLLLDNYSKIIFLEEDIVTAPGFLSFMNGALTHYEHYENVLSISGYTHPFLVPKKFRPDCFFLGRFSAWGFGTWESKFDPFGFSLDNKNIPKNIDSKEFKKFYSKSGSDLLEFIQHEISGSIDALDVKVMYHMLEKNQITIYPKKSLVRNIGNDGSGLHCSKTSKFDTKLWEKNEEFEFCIDQTAQKQIKFRNKLLRDREILSRVLFKILQYINY